MNVCHPPMQSKPWITLTDAWIETLSQYITSDIQVQYLLFDETMLIRVDNFFLQVTCNGRIKSSTVSSLWKPPGVLIASLCWDYSVTLALGYLIAQITKILCPLVFLLMWLKLSMLGVEVESNWLGFFSLVLKLNFIHICRTESFCPSIIGISMQPLCLSIHL